MEEDETVVWSVSLHFRAHRQKEKGLSRSDGDKYRKKERDEKWEKEIEEEKVETGGNLVHDVLRHAVFTETYTKHTHTDVKPH